MDKQKTKRVATFALGAVLTLTGVFLIGRAIYVSYKAEKTKQELIRRAEGMSTHLQEDAGKISVDDNEFLIERTKDIQDGYVTDDETFVDILTTEGNLGLDGDMVIAEIKEDSKVLEIPDLDIKVPILEGVGYDTLKVAVGHFIGTGEGVGAGNYCVAGHSVSPYACIFDNLHNVKLDIPIYVRDSDGTEYTFWVVDWQVVQPFETWVLGDFGDDRLTLVTCEDRGKTRLVVTALEMTEEEHIAYIRNREVDKRLDVQDISYDLANIDIYEYFERYGLVGDTDRY